MAAQTEVCPRTATRSGASPHGLRSQSSTDWTNTLSHSTGIQTRNHSDLLSKGSRQMPSLGQALKCALFAVFGSKIMVRTNYPSKLSSSSSSLPSSQSAGPPPHGTPRIAGGENLFPPAKLEENHCRPMGVGSSSGIQVRANEPAAAVAHTVFRDRREVCRPDFGRDRIYVGQEGHTVTFNKTQQKVSFPVSSLSPKKAENSGQL